MAGKQMRAAVIGAGTILGKELVEELNNSPAVAWDIQLLDESEEGEAQLSASGDEAVVIQPLNPESLEDVDLVFFASTPETAREFREAATRAGAAIVDLTGALEGEPGFLVRCPWIRGGTKPDLMTTGVVAAHPAAVMLALTVDRISRRLGLERLTATVLEPASQAGRGGVDELHQQTVSLLSFQTVPKEIFDVQIAFNLQPELGEAAKVDLGAVSERIRSDVRALLGSAAANVRFQVVQAPVFHGYTISALGDFKEVATEEAVREALNGGVVQAEADTAPSNLAVTDSGDLLFRVHKDENDSSGKAHWLWIAADNLRLAARNAVAASLELAALRPTANVQ